MSSRPNSHPAPVWSTRPCIQPSCRVVLLLVIFSCGLIMACGPGRTGADDRPDKSPMKLKQRIPETDETSMSASGKYTGRVRRGSEAYKALQSNYNPDIIFRDDEKNGDDRLMTKNCNVKLNELAKRVKAKWGSKGVKLRVIDAYNIDDGNKRHSPTSLHHEGRAVDLTTSDRDKEKYPILGRMAYDAGFNWVLYPSKGYIHASVKTDEHADDEVGCFPETASVRVEGGRTKTMKDLRIGDKVASMDATGKIVYSKVLTFLDIQRNTTTEYLNIETKNPAAEVAITESHLIYQLNKHSSREAALFARDLKVGDFVYVHKGSTLEKLTAGRITAIKKTEGKGAYAPLTQAGNIVVDNVLCSCYAVISDAQLAHWSFAPIRFGEWLFPGVSRHNTTGVHWYASLLYNLYTSWNYVRENVLDSS